MTITRYINEKDFPEKLNLARRVCPIIFLLDASGSMRGEVIGAVNEAMEQIIPELKSMDESNNDYDIKIAIATFADSVVWHTGNDLVKPGDYHFNLLNADGNTAMGQAFKELNERLSTSHGFMRQASGSTAPVLFLLSDGWPDEGYEADLAALQTNGWYKEAYRVAIGFGDDCEYDVLNQFTGNKGTVLRSDDPRNLSELIKFIAVKSSQVASSSKNTGEGTKDNTEELSEEIAAQANDGMVELKYANNPDDEFKD